MAYQYDIHVHTEESPCSGTSPESVIDGALDSGLDGIAVTDHDTIRGAERVVAAAPEALEVIVGSEVTTQNGHLLALGIRNSPEPGMDVISTIEAVHDQNGVAVLAHPFDSFRQTHRDDHPELIAAIDGIETINSRCLLKRFNHQAAMFAEEHSLPMTGGSDAHFTHEIGRAWTAAQGSLLKSIRQGNVSPVGRGGYTSGHIATKLQQGRTLLSRR